MEQNKQEVDPRLRGLASVLKQGRLPTSDDIESSSLFNQSYKDGSLDVVIQSIASRVPNTDQVHRTALALSLPYNLQRLNPETRSDLIAALSTDSNTRTILVQSAPNLSPTIQTEIARTLNSSIPQTTLVSAASGAGSGAALGGSATPISNSRTEEVLRTSAQIAVRAIDVASPATGLLLEGARLILPHVVEDRNSLPPFIESLIWSPSTPGTVPSSSNPMQDVLPILLKDLPNSGSREALREEGSSAEAGTAIGASIGSEAAARAGENVGRGAVADPQNYSNPAPSPVPSERIQGSFFQPSTLQNVLIGLSPSTFLPLLSAAAALQSSGWLSASGVSSFWAPNSGAILTYASVTPVTSSSETHSDSDGSGQSHSGNEQSSGGNSSQGGQNPNDENPRREPESQLA
jgi:hypothetical protein